MLVGFTSYWSVFDAKALKGKDANKRPLLEQQQIQRGRILAADGTVIARSVAEGQGQRPALRPPLPGGRALRPPDRLQLRAARATASSSSSTTTSWSATNRNSARSSTSCAARTRKATTSSPTSTRRRSGSRSTTSKQPASAPWSRSSRRPAQVKVMASNPPYDPNRVPYELAKLNTNEIETPLFNRATQGQLPAGLDLQGGDRGGRPRQRHDHAGNADRRARRRSTSRASRWRTTSARTSARSTLDTALTNSVNTWFGQLGEQVGKDTLFEYMERFGFNSKPRDRPARRRALRRAASTTKNGDCSSANDPVDIGPGRDRPGAAAGDAAADGRGRRRGRQRAAS